MSVIVIAFNTEKYLTNAVTSVLRQSLRALEVIIVDDCSTDNTSEVAEGLCSLDERVSYVRLPANSGGGGAPRNIGMRLARGEYMMFLDSDDELERHACKNLLREAELTGSELVVGKMIRRFVADPAKDHAWYPRLFKDRVNVSSIEGFPQLVHDTSPTNKMYRKSFFERTGAQFPEGMHYEDLAFTAQLYVAVNGIAIIPEHVYDWKVYPTEERKSITNQRDNFKNIEDRIHAVDIACQYFIEIGGDVEFEYERKILANHMKLCIDDIASADDEWAQKVLDEIRPLLMRISLEVFDELSPAQRALYVSACEGDLDSLRFALSTIRFRGLSGNLEAHGERVFWKPRVSDVRHFANVRARELADFSHYEGVLQPHDRVRYVHRVDKAEIVGGMLRVRGYTNDPMGYMRSENTRVRLHLKNGSSRVDQVSEAEVIFGEDRARWQVKIPFPIRAGLTDREGREFFVESITADGLSNMSGLVFSEPGGIRLPDRSAVGRALGDRWKMVSAPERRGLIEIETKTLGKAVRRVVVLPRRVVSWLRRQVQRGKKHVAPTGRFGLRFIYPFFRQLPLNSRTVLFESHIGKSAFDNPRAVCDELASRKPETKVIWATDGIAVTAEDFPDVKLVRRNSFAYLLALATSARLVDNQSLPSYFVKRQGQRYLQTWHGIPFKRMGVDLPAENPLRAMKQLAQHSEKWDGLCVASPYFEEVFVPAFGYKGELVKYGSPRLDALVRGEIEASAVKRRLGIPEHAKVVLYCPTFRPGSWKSGKARMYLNFDRWIEDLGKDVVLLVRAHYLNRFEIEPSQTKQCLDVSSYGDISELYAVADVLITDYSSVMFDFAVLDRPIVVLAPDYERYTQQAPGSYFDLRETPPGALVENVDEIYDVVRSELEETKFSSELAQFRKLYAGYEDGHAAKRAVDFLMEGV